MNKTKTFTQYTNSCLNISLKIGIDERIHEGSIIIYKGNMSRNGNKKWKEENKEHRKEYGKKYYKNNKEIISVKAKQYRLDNTDKIKLADKKRAPHKKQYRKNNPEKVRAWDIKSRAKRKEWGYNPINKYFKGSHFHHLHINGDKNIGIYIPAEIHKSVWHSNKDQKTIDKINNLAFEWLKNNKDY